MGRDQAMVLVALGRGLSEQQVAQQLFLSLRAVRSHVDVACQRLGATDLDSAIGTLLGTRTA